MALPDVTGVGTGRDEQTGADVVVLYVTRRPVAGDDTAGSLPRVVDGIPVQVVVVGDLHAQSADPSASDS